MPTRHGIIFLRGLLAAIELESDEMSGPAITRAPAVAL